MTPDERKMLEDLAEKIQKTPPPPKDPEAEEFIRRNIGSRPDALYLMTQTVLIQNLALEQARQQIQELQRAGQPAASSGTSFLGGVGRSIPGYAGSSYATPSSPQPSYAPPPPQYNPPSPAPPSPGGAGSFLRGAAQTAAGVAAGALAFEGIRSLFSHSLGGYGGFGGGYVGAPIEETVIENNYFDQPQPQEAGASDFQDRGDDSYQNSADVVNVDDSSQYDDGANFDDGSGFDDAGDTGDVGGFDDGGSWV